MKRLGDEVKFDSHEQQSQFEKALLRKKGTNEIVLELLEAIGRSSIDSDHWWAKIQSELVASGKYSRETESLVYDWVERSLKVKRNIALSAEEA